MFIIGILFISPTCSIVIVLSILSVSFGVLGLLHFLNAKLDPTSMITLAMSVGFSVDFASHVTYAFISVDSSDPMIKLRGALRSVGWPITQTSSAVLFGIITLGTVRNQLVQTVFKAVLLVIVFGSIHALVYIPLLLLKVQQIWLFLNK
jgi:predicted RND superfamily exporter protein